jgi:hypothetical protein
MSSITLTFELACTREEAARFAAVELFLAEMAENAEAEPPAELDAIFGARPRETILGLAGYPQPLGITCRYDREGGVMTLATHRAANPTSPRSRCCCSGSIPTSCPSPTRST